MSAKLRTKDINLLVPYRKKAGMEQSKAALLKLAALPVGIVLVCGVLFGALTLWAGGIDRNTEETLRYINDANVNQKYMDAQESGAKLSRYSSRLASITQLKQRMSRYPQLNRGVFQAVLGACSGELSLEQITYSDLDGTMLLQVTTPNITQVPSCVTKLKDSGLFESVVYYGYNMDEERYTLQLSCTLKEGELDDE